MDLDSKIAKLRRITNMYCTLYSAESLTIIAKHFTVVKPKLSLKTSLYKGL